MRISRKALAVIILVLLVTLAVGFKLFSPLKVHYGTVQRRHLVQEVFGTGTVEARVLVIAGTKIAGRVKKVYTDQGDEVKKGQLLAVLESEDLQALARQAEYSGRKAVSMEAASQNDLARAEAALRAADAAVKRSDAALRLAEQTLSRYDELFGRGIVSRQDLDEKQAAHDEALRQRDTLEAETTAANAEVERLKNALDAARHEAGAGSASSAYARARLDDAFIKSSIDGVVVSRDAEEGDAVVPGSPVFHIADPASVWVKANIDEAQGGGIVLGNPARVYLRSSKDAPLPGVVARVAQESDRVTEEMEVDVSFPLRDKDVLHLGEQVEVYVRGEEKDCLSVPLAAVTIREGREGVFAIAGNRARFVPVKTGVWTGDFVEISGLGEGEDVVILSGSQGAGLKDGARVKPVQPASERDK